MNPKNPAMAIQRMAVVSLVVGCMSVTGSLFADDPAHSYSELPISESDRLHWSFRPVAPVQIPPSPVPQWRHNGIDDFVGAVLEQNRLHPRAAARRRTLIRRLNFDLIGLPPLPAEIEAFCSDEDEHAFEKLVDRLLASHGYGERWAQHWLDLARFAETDGFEHDKTRPEAWKYRDWVIDALNDDMPYSEFIRRQIAGDELYPESESAHTATRFCLSGPDMPDINLIEERRHTLLNEITSTVGEVILGLQVGCAQCHDHKYDPISQADFYRLRAIFEPAVQLQKDKSLTELQEVFPFPRPSQLMLRGDFRRPGPNVVSGVPRVIVVAENSFQPKSTKASAGYRTALATWLVSPDNPLTARVIVNRVWQHHFGNGLVTSPSDFGVMGSEPSHPELLDWLATWFVDNNWSLKRLHRLIVTSATWQQQSLIPSEASDDQREDWAVALSVDPKARLLSRYPRFRLDGEAIRDAMLSAAGQLNVRTGGPGVRPPLPQELVGTLLKNQWEVTQDTSEHNRRSIYVFARRNLRYPVFEVFDRPSANASCPERGVSTTAPQSLHLLNSEFSLATARHLAELVRKSSGKQQTQVDEAFLRTLGRTPDSEERVHVERFLKDSSKDGSIDDPLTHLCLSLFNCNEFLFID